MAEWLASPEFLAMMTEKATNYRKPTKRGNERAIDQGMDLGYAKTRA